MAKKAMQYWSTLLTPAPGELALVQALVNSADRVTGRDELTGPEALNGWLARWRLAPAETETAEADLERLLDLRRALHALLASRPGAVLTSDTVARLDRAAAAAPLCLRFGADGRSRLEAAGGGAEAVVARLLAAVHEARAGGTWERLRLCANPDCRRAFYDTSNNRTGRWCSMRLCGNEIKARKYRRKQRRTRARSQRAALQRYERRERVRAWKARQQEAEAPPPTGASGGEENRS